MPDLVIRTGDQATFNPPFGPAIVSVIPGVITGTGISTIQGPIACVLGDEASVIVPGAPYISGAFLTPGIGTLSIAALNADQIALKTQFANKPAILRGTQFTARFTVNVPAVNPNSGVPDPVPFYVGTGQFVTSNIVFQGT